MICRVCCGRTTSGSPTGCLPKSNCPTERRSLVGAWFTHEFSVEAAALFNPSAVAHPDQSDLAPGECRFILSLRAVGEGHLSCVEFRTGVMGPGGALRVDDPGRHLEAGRILPTSYDRDVFAAALAGADIDRESSAFVVGRLPARFDGGRARSRAYGPDRGAADPPHRGTHR